MNCRGFLGAKQTAPDLARTDMFFTGVMRDKRIKRCGDDSDSAVGVIKFCVIIIDII